jgi:hypothetical protein
MTSSLISSDPWNVASYIMISTWELLHVTVEIEFLFYTFEQIMRPFRFVMYVLRSLSRYKF